MVGVWDRMGWGEVRRDGIGVEWGTGVMGSVANNVPSHPWLQLYSDSNSTHHAPSVVGVWGGVRWNGVE